MKGLVCRIIDIRTLKERTEKLTKAIIYLKTKYFPCAVPGLRKQSWMIFSSIHFLSL